MKITLVIVTALAAFLLGVFRPFYNQDLVAYVAASYQWDGYKGKELSDITYRTIQNHVSEGKFDELTTGTAASYSDPAILEKNIPLYSVKVGYLFLLRMTKLLFGCDYVKATVLISSIFAALSVLVLALILIKEGIGIYFLPAIVLTAGFLDLARLATPDAVVCFLVLVCVHIIQKRIQVLLILLILPLFRPDSLIISFSLMGYFFIEGTKLLSVLALMISLSIYLWEIKNSGNSGWANLFYINFIPHDPSQLEIPAKPPSLFTYLKIYFERFCAIGSSGRLTLWIFSICVFVQKKMLKNIKNEDVVYLLMPLVYVTLHLAYFPNYEQRYFSFTDALLLVWLLKNFKAVAGSEPERTKRL